MVPGGQVPTASPKERLLDILLYQFFAVSTSVNNTPNSIGKSWFCSTVDRKLWCFKLRRLTNRCILDKLGLYTNEPPKGENKHKSTMDVPMVCLKCLLCVCTIRRLAHRFWWGPTRKIAHKAYIVLWETEDSIQLPSQFQEKTKRPAYLWIPKPSNTTDEVARGFPWSNCWSWAGLWCQVPVAQMLLCVSGYGGIPDTCTFLEEGWEVLVSF